MKEPPIKAAKFYLKAVMVCPDCDEEQEILINRDEYVYHECNEGNVRCNVPELKLSDPRPVVVKPLLITKGISK